VTIDYLLFLQDKRFLDISELTDEQASVMSDMVNLLKPRST
jgi:hypothetical protein